jgi:hypothetical protein
MKATRRTNEKRSNEELTNVCEQKAQVLTTLACRMYVAGTKTNYNARRKALRFNRLNQAHHAQVIALQRCDVSLKPS